MWPLLHVGSQLSHQGSRWLIYSPADAPPGISWHFHISIALPCKEILPLSWLDWSGGGLFKFICQALCHLGGTFTCSVYSGVISLHVQNSWSDHWGHVIDIENKRGPSSDPCGTPRVTVNQFDATPLITTLCCLCERKSLYQFREILLMPTECSFLMRQVCEIVSNALVKSMNTAATTFPLSIASLQSSIVRRRTSSVEWPGRNPDWWDVRRLFFSRWCMQRSVGRQYATVFSPR